MKRTSELYLRDILDAIAHVQEYTQDMDHDDFCTDRKTFDAVRSNLQVIGEAVSQIDQQLKRHYPTVPWIFISGFRNVIVHQYWGLDVDIIWDIVCKKLEPLRDQVEQILRDINNKR